MRKFFKRLFLEFFKGCLYRHVQLSTPFPHTFRSSNDDSFLIAERLRVVEGAVGSGIHRKVVFGRGLSPDYNQGSSSEFKTSAIPNATLEFASLCLRNALLLLPNADGSGGGIVTGSGTGGVSSSTSSSGVSSFTSLFDDVSGSSSSSGMTTSLSAAKGSSSTTSMTNPLDAISSSNAPASAMELSSNAAGGSGGGGASSDAPLHPVDGPFHCSVAPSNPIRTATEVSSLRCSILAASAYVALNLSDSVVALRHAKALLAQPKLSGAHKFLGRLYMSEALLNLDNISEAVRGGEYGVKKKN